MFDFDQIMLPSLKMLIMNNNKLYHIAFIKHLPTLKVLIVSSNKLASLATPDTDSGLNNLPLLEYLDASNNHLIDLNGL
jgi:Leucine-rich repeat (LRR) protein